MPEAVGPYSLGKLVKISDGRTFVYTSGQLGIDPKTGQLASDLETQTEQALTNLKNLVEDSGFDLDKHCIKNTLYLIDMGDFANVNDIYKRYFTSDFPARTTVGVKELPKGARFEIESILFKA